MTTKAMACILEKDEQEVALARMMARFRACPDPAIAAWAIQGAETCRQLLGTSVALDFLMSGFRDDDCNLTHSDDHEAMLNRMSQFLRTVAFEECDLIDHPQGPTVQSTGWRIVGWLLIALVAWAILMACCFVCFGQSSKFYGPQGKPAGSSQQIGSRTKFFDAHGKPSGSAVQSGGTIKYFDAAGKPTGSATTAGSTTRVLDAQGKTAATQTQTGNTTTFRSPSGSITGRATTSGGTTKFSDSKGRPAGSRK